MGSTETAPSDLKYWLVVGFLIAFGLLTIFSIGLYFWVLAAALIVLSPFRSRPKVFLPGLALFLGSLFGYVLVAPRTCSQSFMENPDTGVEVTSDVVCTSPTGVTVFRRRTIRTGPHPGPDHRDSHRRRCRDRYLAGYPIAVGFTDRQPVGLHVAAVLATD